MHKSMFTNAVHLVWAYAEVQAVTSRAHHMDTVIFLVSRHICDRVGMMVEHSPLTCVWAKVTFECSMAGESPVAFAADVAADAGVDFHVLLQSRLGLETLSTEQAEDGHVWPWKEDTKHRRVKAESAGRIYRNVTALIKTSNLRTVSDRMHPSWKWTQKWPLGLFVFLKFTWERPLMCR